MTDTVAAAREAASDAAGMFLTNTGLADRFSGVSREQWHAFIAAVTDAYEAKRDELQEREAIQEADDVPF